MFVLYVVELLFFAGILISLTFQLISRTNNYTQFWVIIPKQDYITTRLYKIDNKRIFATTNLTDFTKIVYLLTLFLVENVKGYCNIVL